MEGFKFGRSCRAESVTEALLSLGTRLVGRDTRPVRTSSEFVCAVIDELREGRRTPSYLAELIGESRQLISRRLRDLVTAVYVEKSHTGLYELAEDRTRM